MNGESTAQMFLRRQTVVTLGKQKYFLAYTYDMYGAKIIVDASGLRREMCFSVES